MKEEYKYYFKVKNHTLYGGKGSEGYAAIKVNEKYNDPVEALKGFFYLCDEKELAEIVEISEKEYLKNTED